MPDVIDGIGGHDFATLEPLERHLAESGLGSVSETADGNAPHDATGCPFQAWSVAELLRARRLIARSGAHRNAGKPTAPNERG